MIPDFTLNLAAELSEGWGPPLLDCLDARGSSEATSLT